MIEASPSRCTPEQWTAEQAARAMGVVDEADGDALGVDGAEVGEIGVAGEVGREEPTPRGGMRWVAGGTALAVVAAGAWWSGAGNGDSREIPVHAGADGALIAGERTPNSGPGDFNSSNGSSPMKIQTTAAAALLGAAAIAFQAQAEELSTVSSFESTVASQWNVADMEFVGRRLALGLIEQSKLGEIRFLEPTESGWEFSQMTIASPSADCRALGRTLVSNGDHLAVGSDSGHVYIFSTVNQTPTLVASWRAEPVGYAQVLSMIGNYVLVGLPASNGGEGGGVLLRLEGTSLTVVENLVPGQAAGKLGWSGGMSADTIILSAEEYYGNWHAMIWQRRSNGAWEFDSELHPSNPAGNSIFGCSSSIEGNVIAVGARDDSAAGFASGACYVFERVNDVWVQTSKLSLQEEPFSNQETGAQVTVHGGRIWISASGSSENGTNDRGRLLVADRINGTWTITQTLRSKESNSPTFWGYGACFGPNGTVAAYGFDSPTPYSAWRLKCDMFAPIADCDESGTHDILQIWNGTLADTNTNGVPDICEARLIIRVPADQPTIQAAIDAAPLNTQCIVAVSAGTYAGPIDFKGKSVIVRGAGASQTVISGSAGSTLSVVRFTGGEPAFAALENVSIRGGVTGSPFPGSPQFQVGGGLFAYNSAASVRDCVFENNTAAFGGGAYVWNCTGSIQRCAFRNNSAGADGAGIQLYRGSPTVVDTIVENNTANSRGGGLHIVDGTPNLVRTIVRNNISSNNVGGVSWVPAGNAAAFLSIDGCNVTGNTAAVVQGGIGILEDGATTKVSLHGTTVCGNLPRPNVAGRFIDLGGNVVCDCGGDLNLDGVVNGADLGLMLSGWGPCGSSCLYDLNVDGAVNGADLGLLLAAWGTCGS